MKRKHRKTTHGSLNLRNSFSFLLTFMISILIFGSIAALLLHFSMPALNSSDENALEPVHSSSDSSSDASSDFPASNTMTMLISIRSDPNGEPAELILYRLDAAKRRILLMPISPNLEVNYNSDAHAIREVVKTDGIKPASIALANLLSAKIDFSCDIYYDNFIKIFDSIGGLYFYVPQNVDAALPDQSKISLPESTRQYLDGSKIYALLSFPSYNGGDTERYNVQADLMKEFISEKFTDFYLKSNTSQFSGLFNYVSTDFSMNELVKRADAMTFLSSEKYITAVAPSFSDYPAGNGLLQFSEADLIKNYFK